MEGAVMTPKKVWGPDASDWGKWTQESAEEKPSSLPSTPRRVSNHRTRNVERRSPGTAESEMTRVVASVPSLFMPPIVPPGPSGGVSTLPRTESLVSVSSVSSASRPPSREPSSLRSSFPAPDTKDEIADEDFRNLISPEGKINLDPGRYSFAEIPTLKLQNGKELPLRCENCKGHYVRCNDCGCNTCVIDSSFPMDAANGFPCPDCGTANDARSKQCQICGAIFSGLPALTAESREMIALKAHISKCEDRITNLHCQLTETTAELHRIQGIQNEATERGVNQIESEQSWLEALFRALGPCDINSTGKGTGAKAVHDSAVSGHSMQASRQSVNEWHGAAGRRGAIESEDNGIIHAVVRGTHGTFLQC